MRRVDFEYKRLGQGWTIWFKSHSNQFTLRWWKLILRCCGKERQRWSEWQTTLLSIVEGHDGWCVLANMYGVVVSESHTGLPHVWTKCPANVICGQKDDLFIVYIIYIFFFIITTYINYGKERTAATNHHNRCEIITCSNDRRLPGSVC
jgi:hypothetical protein